MKNRYEVRGEDVVIFMPHKKIGKVFETVVSAGDFDLVNSHGGTYFAAWSTTGKAGSVVSSAEVEGKRKQFFLHKFILGVGKEAQVDHIHGDTLDNRRHELRKITHSGNSLNRHRGATKKYGVPRGVFWNKAIKKWIARIERYGKVVGLGSYEDPLVAGAVVEKARAEMIARELF